FFTQVVVVNSLQIIGPTSHLKNSKFYSAVPPRQINRYERSLPHVTIRMPVYKEGLEVVTKPTIEFVKAVISTYELQGGTATIYVCEDRMQLASEADQEARCHFY
ncbi:hypothetical protein BJ878DRAFT_389622, partial [Calycina marina]